MITNNEPRTKLETLPSPLLVFTVFRFSTVYRSLPFRVQMEIWFIEEGSRRLAPWKIRNTARGATRYRGRKAAATDDKLNGIYGHGRDCLHRFWESYSSLRSRKWRKCSGFNHSFLSRASSPVWRKRNKRGDRLSNVV